jgi:CRISPR/Cas system CSM-associated protein Csm3 (group 7 of RAMP superfamily)
MPLNEKFVNPYRMLELPESFTVPPRISHHAFSGLSGHVEAELLTVTPLVIGGRKAGGEPEDKCFAYDPSRGEVPVIPGSGLKGALKQYFEMLAGPLPASGYNPFGHFQRGQNGDAIKGAISFNDARMDVSHSVARYSKGSSVPVIVTVLQSPKDRHSAFYGKSPAGRIKVYHHQPKVKMRIDLRKNPPSENIATKVYAIPAGCRFQFSFYFTSLDYESLAYLLHSVFLPSGCCHKIGGAKPLGAGSVHIRPTSIRIADKKHQYSGASGNFQESYVGTEICLDYINGQHSCISYLPDFLRMMCWRPSDTKEYCYPPKAWFNTHSSTPLKSVASIYPEELNKSMAAGAIAIGEAWKTNSELVVAPAKVSALVSSIERAFNKWLESGQKQPLSLDDVFNLTLLNGIGFELNDSEKAELQVRMLKHLAQIPNYIKDAKKKHKKSEGKKGKWLELCALAALRGVDGFKVEE